jgi:PKD repeat protein
MAENGNKRKMYLTDGIGTGSLVWVAGETSSNLSLQRNMIETSDKRSSHATFVAGRQSGTSSVTVNLDDTATESQRKMVKAFHNGQSIFVFHGEVSEGNEPLNGTAYEALISGLDRDYPDDGVVTATFNLQLTGAPVEYPTNS